MIFEKPLDCLKPEDFYFHSAMISSRIGDKMNKDTYSLRYSRFVVPFSADGVGEGEVKYDAMLVNFRIQF